MGNKQSLLNSQLKSWVKRAAGETERIEACFSGLAYAPHSHDTYTLALTTFGVQSFNYRGELRHSLPGEVVILHPDEPHDGQAGTDSPFAYRAISINPVEVQNILQGASLPFLPGGVSRDPRFLHIASQLLAEFNRPLQTLEQQELIYAFASSLQQVSGNSVKHTQANYAAIKRVREYIDDIITIDCAMPHDITLDELAVIAQYSKWQVARDFRSLYGTTPYRYVTLKRLQKAKALIERGQPLAQVAFSSGFADQSHLTRHFKQCFGTTPKVWVKLHLASIS
ncbi:MAG: AraC family transcriptional regulator [Gammaproteobacteria bacterium]|nr:AraC family transcriptional regulator [Gammaproteobacteria bacterium]